VQQKKRGTAKKYGVISNESHTNKRI